MEAELIFKAARLFAGLLYEFECKWDSRNQEYWVNILLILQLSPSAFLRGQIWLAEKESTWITDQLASFS